MYYDTKQNILAKKTTKSIVVKDINSNISSNADSIIYINNHVTPFFGKLLAEGRKATKAKQIHSCWMSSIGAQLKFSEDGKHHLYTTAEQISELINKHTNQSSNNGKRTAPDDVNDDDRKAKRNTNKHT